MSLLTVLTLAALACGHEELNFALPDAGRDASHNAAGSGMQAPYAASDAVGADSLEPTALGVDSLQGSGGAASAAGSGDAAPAAGGGGTSATFDGGVGQADRYQDDPDGYPTGPGQTTLGCMRGLSIAEVCANDLDDDCDGTVDEYPGIGEPCTSGCGEGAYACSASTNALLCRGFRGCVNPNPLPAPCGDGFVGGDEECDPHVPSETPGVTCTLTCNRPLFVPCVQAGVPFPEFCDDLHVCNERIGACVPVIGPRQPRCPQVRIEGSAAEDAFYPMLEAEDGECWVTCTEREQCPSSLSECYMGFCVVPF